jgi:hypothetical protein
MKLMRIGEPGRERPAVLVDDDHHVDVTAEVGDFDENFFGSGGMGLLPNLVAGLEPLPNGGERIGAPIARPHQILCIGLNYSDHAAETGQAVPTEPILFTKSPNTLVGPNDDVRLPRGYSKADWEVELGIVIGRRTSYLDSVDQAAGAIAGYTVVNDVSERAFQMERGGQWSKGKSAETFKLGIAGRLPHRDRAGGDDLPGRHGHAPARGARVRDLDAGTDARRQLHLLEPRLRGGPAESGRGPGRRRQPDHPHRSAGGRPGHLHRPRRRRRNTGQGARRPHLTRKL